MERILLLLAINLGTDAQKGVSEAKRDGEEGAADGEASDKVGAGRAVPQPAPRHGKHIAQPETLSAAPRCRSKHTCSALGAAGNTPSTTRRVRQKRDGEEGAAGEEASDKVGAGQAVPQPPPPRKTKSTAVGCWLSAASAAKKRSPMQRQARKAQQLCTATMTTPKGCAGAPENLAQIGQWPQKRKLTTTRATAQAGKGMRLPGRRAPCWQLSRGGLPLAQPAVKSELNHCAEFLLIIFSPPSVKNGM